MQPFTLTPQQITVKQSKKPRSSGQARKRPVGQELFAFARPKLPVTYGECLPGRDARRSGKACQHFTCRHNLIGELTRMSTRDAIRAACARLRCDVVDSCALDASECGVCDRDIATLLGTGLSTLRRDTRNAQRHIEANLRDWKPWEHPECWVSQP